MSSSIRNAAPRRNHKERGQLANRKKLGLLEKHKDYILRARDYHSKQDRLNRLRIKAGERNKDEFYFGMVKGRTEGGVHVQERGNVSLPVDVVKVLKSQDANYIRTQKAANLRRIEALKAQLVLLADLLPSTSGLTASELKTLKTAGLVAGSALSKGKLSAVKRTGHVVFAETEEEGMPVMSTAGKDEDGDEEFHIDTTPMDLDALGWLPPSSKGKRRSTAPSQAASDPDLNELSTEAERIQHRSHLLAELAARQLRDHQLRFALSELELQKVLMGPGGKKKLREAEEVKFDDDVEKGDEDGEERKKEERTWRPRVFKWKFVRSK
ncbi:small-subunit processome [Dacryopinax primogenitus]|uniref:Small-subunit processome n=1 Tax=Dacryopinax primogenitus (strain DJM 731) TaxID=1858805 RepID=M5G8E3_DACPD|nr:small-subunit processome [Dacryopinax primogenitus]EJU00033.1 small-subunit processome [Dacryopinax primogenitus]